MCRQYGRKPRSQRLPWCRDGTSLGEPVLPGIQLSTDILDWTALVWLIYEIVQRAEKSIENNNQVPMLWREKARSKMESAPIGCQEPLISSPPRGGQS